MGRVLRDVGVGRLGVLVSSDAALGVFGGMLFSSMETLSSAGVFWLSLCPGVDMAAVVVV